MIKTKIFLILLIIFSLLILNCGEKEKTKKEQPKELPTDTIPSFSDTSRSSLPPSNLPPAPSENKPKPAPPQTKPPAHISNPVTPRIEQRQKKLIKYPVTLRIQFIKIPGIETKFKITHMGHDIYVGNDTEIKLKIDSTNFDKEAQIESFFYYPIKFNFKKDEKIDLQLEPIIAKVKFYDKSGLYSDKLNKIIVKIDGKKVGETDDQGIAKIFLKNQGSNRLECYKFGVIKKQYVTINFTNPDSMYQIGLDPFEHFVQLRLLDDNGKPLSQKKVILYGGLGITLEGTTSPDGFIKFSDVKLGTGFYTIQIPEYSFKNDRLEIGSNVLDKDGKYLSLKIPLKIGWVIEADISLASLKLFSPDGKLIVEGTGSIQTKLPKGVYKVIADYKDAHREVIFSSTDTPHRLAIIVMHPYLSARKWQKKNPGKKIPSNYIQAMKNISPSDKYFIDSRLFLAKIFIDYQKDYDTAVRMYQEIFDADQSSQYKSDILFQMAQAIMLSTEKIDNTKKEKELRLRKALEEYCDKAWAYLSYLPQKSRRFWGMKITALRGEINYRLSTYKEENNDTREARRYAEAAKDYFKQFKMDYEALPASHKLKKELQNDYYRVSDLLSMIESKMF